MGSGASSSVKSININSSKQSSTLDVGKNDTADVGQHNGKAIHEKELSQTQRKEESSKKEDAVQAIKKELADVESDKLDLLDRIHLLEAQIDYLNTENYLQRQRDGCEETIHAKDQYIKKLEKETQTAQEDLQKLKVKLKRKVKFYSTQLTEVKQEASIQRLELQDEVNRLTEENTCLLEKLRLRGTKGENDQSDGFMANNPVDDGRSKLVLELSHQLNEQYERIEELDRNISERDKIINNLKDGHASHKGEKALNSTKFDKDSKSESSKRKATANSDNKNSPDIFNSDSESEMKSIMEEMKNLRRGHFHKHRLGEKKLAKENSRGSSGQSRDSGVISPDSKIETVLTNARPVSAVSTLSGLSLEESEQMRSSKHSTVHSAPVGSSRNKPPIYSAKTTHLDKSDANIYIHSDNQSHKNLSTKRKKRFALKQRLESETEAVKPLPKLNPFTDTHTDVEY